jgi:hypothetical protein
MFRMFWQPLKVFAIPKTKTPFIFSPTTKRFIISRNSRNKEIYILIYLVYRKLIPTVKLVLIKIKLRTKNIDCEKLRSFSSTLNISLWHAKRCFKFIFLICLLITREILHFILIDKRTNHTWCIQKKHKFKEYVRKSIWAMTSRMK